MNAGTSTRPGLRIVAQHFNEQVVLDRYHHVVAAFASSRHTFVLTVPAPLQQTST